MKSCNSKPIVLSPGSTEPRRPPARLPPPDFLIPPKGSIAVFVTIRLRRAGCDDRRLGGDLPGSPERRGRPPGRIRHIQGDGPLKRLPCPDRRPAGADLRG